MSRLEISMNSLFEKSVEKKNYNLALKEWEYWGDSYDLEYPSETCELCGKKDIRYQFELVNTKNGEYLYVGSECIFKFGDVKVRNEAGKVVTGQDAKARVSRDRAKLITDARTRSVLNSLISLASKSNGKIPIDFQDFVKYYKERGAFTPKQLALVLWQFKELSIPYTLSYFKTVITRDREKQQLLNMPAWQIQKMLPALSTSQKNFLKRNGKI
jgi:hypothetical protein